MFRTQIAHINEETEVTGTCFFLNYTEAPGDGHKADEDVCVRGAERVETGAPAAQPA